MELSARYDRNLFGNAKGFLYVAPAGEPALGPVAFPHRGSSQEFPLALIGHHWQDSTHISFGVLTAGIYGTKWQAESSAFTGREPDEYRWNIDSIHPDSYSGRLTYNPTDNWSFSGSYGFLHSPEALHPEEDMQRAVVSAMYARPWGNGDDIAATAVWGRNTMNHADSDSYLIEGTYTRNLRHHLFARVEEVSKSGEELLVTPPDANHDIAAGTVGYSYDFHRDSQVVGIGGGVTFYDVPSELRSAYGSDLTSYVIFLLARPARTMTISMPHH